MRAGNIFAVIVGLLGTWIVPGLAAETDGKAHAFDPRSTFAPVTRLLPVNRYRSASGAPGPDYWQNRGDYTIVARLDPAAKTLSGEVTIAYTNASPDALDSLWLQLDQNVYRRDARAASLHDRTQFTDGDVLDAVEIERGGSFVPARYLVSDTRLQIRLPAVLPPNGGHTRLRIRYHYTVPGEFGGRTQWEATPNGTIFEIAQWYPRLAVYDDIGGWDTLPYLGSEFHLEYGNLDYAVTVPADMIVVGSGALTNPDEVLTSEQMARLAQARASDRTVAIRTREEVAQAAAPGSATKTWHFHMDHTRDVSFAASHAFVWDAARINLPDGKTALAQSLYPPESGGDKAWGRSTEYLKFAVEDFSRRWFPYPWPNAINVGGPVGGMEYPALVFESAKNEGKALFWITVHEIGHSYFPMIVGTDERRFAWMDEGLNTFIDVAESDAFQGGVYGPKRDSEYAGGEGEPADQIARLLADPEAPPIITYADAIPPRYRHPISYFKPAYGLKLLREDILGPERFDPAFRKFIRDWAYKHPQPADFFRTMESEGGEDLSWFWRGWFFHNWIFDLAIAGVTYVDGDPAKGARIAVDNLGQLVLPATVRVAFADGTMREVILPAETWLQSGHHVIALDSKRPVTRVTIDPDHHLPERDRSHNTWPKEAPR